MRSIGRRSNVLVVLLGAHILLSIAGIIVTFGEIALLERVSRGELITLVEANRSDLRVGLVAVVFFAAFVVTGVVWCMWQYRGQSNLRAVGRRSLEFTPGWAAGWWFVPIASAWKPFQAVRELWKASDPAADAEGWVGARTPVLLGVWWAFFVASNVLAWLSFRGYDDETDVDSLIAADNVSIASDVMWIVAAVLAINIVRAIAARQEALGEAVIVPPRADLDDGGLALPAPPA